MLTKTLAPTRQSDLDLLQDVMTQARRAGASAADAVLFRSTSLSVSLREGKVDLLERSESTDIGLRVFVGQRQANISASDLRAHTFPALIERVMGMVAATPEDPYCGLAEPTQLARHIPDLDLADPTEPEAEQLIKLAGDCEAAARAVPGITNSEGADASWGGTEVVLAATNGFHGAYRSTRASLSTTALAGTGTGMERDYEYDSKVYLADLKDPAWIGRQAGERAVRRLNPQKVKTQQVPVVFEAREAGSVVGHLLSAINGSSVARGMSFLKDKMNTEIFAPGLFVREDPSIARGLRSRPFDAEGLPPQARALVDNGVLTSWLLDLRSARQLKLAPTGHATRGSGGPPSPGSSNVWLEPGQLSAEALIGDIEQGLYVTDILGHGLDLVTGDYSRGAAGWWIENGKLAYPVSEVTMAGNLGTMFRALTPASDLERVRGIDAPTLRIDGMTVAGV